MTKQEIEIAIQNAVNLPYAQARDALMELHRDPVIQKHIVQSEIFKQWAITNKDIIWKEAPR